MNTLLTIQHQRCPKRGKVIKVSFIDNLSVIIDSPKHNTISIRLSLFVNLPDVLYIYLIIGSFSMEKVVYIGLSFVLLGHFEKCIMLW